MWIDYMKKWYKKSYFQQIEVLKITSLAVFRKALVEACGFIPYSVGLVFRSTKEIIKQGRIDFQIDLTLFKYMPWDLQLLKFFLRHIEVRWVGLLQVEQLETQFNPYFNLGFRPIQNTWSHIFIFIFIFERINLNTFYLQVDPLSTLQWIIYIIWRT